MKANMNLEAGMLAMIIGSRNNPENVGKVVTLVRFLKEGEYLEEADAIIMDDAWVVSGENIRCFMECGETGEPIVEFNNFGAVVPYNLMPIRPEEDPLEVEAEEERERGMKVC